MHIQDLILLVVGSEEEKSLRGRTTVQKKLYFLSVLEKTDLGFRPHYYGPYSSWVAENLDILVSTGFLKEVTETFGPASSTPPNDQNIFGEIRRHTYSWTSDSEAVIGEIEKEEGYTDWEAAIRQLNAHSLALDFNTLSIAAKVHYIVKRQGKATREQIQEVAKEYKWNINDSDIKGVLSFLEALSLISVKKPTEPQGA